MAALPEKLVERLNNLSRLGDFKFGKILQECLSQLSNGPGIGACLRLPNYASQSDATDACGKDSGIIYFNSTTNNIEYCNGDDEFVVLDFTAKCIQIDENTASIAVTQASITAIINQLQVLQGDQASIQQTLSTHCHDGTDSAQIIISKILSQASEGVNLDINHVICSDGAGGWFYVDKESFSGGDTVVQVGEGESIIGVASDDEIGIKSISGGCGVDVTSTATEIQVSLGFDTAPNVGVALDIDQDTILIHDASTDQCVQTSLQSLLQALDATSSSCCLPNPGGLTLLDTVYIGSTGTVVPSDISSNETVAQYIVTGFRNNTEVCIQNFGPATFTNPHGLPVGACYFEGPGGTITSIQPTTGVNNVLFHVISPNKISVVAGTRPFELAP